MIRLLFLFCFITLPLFSDTWYSEYWQKFKCEVWRKKPYSLITYGELRSENHMRGLRFLELTEFFIYQYSKNVDFQIHYGYLFLKSVVPHSDWHWEQRIELEANRYFEVSKKFNIFTRNRLEIRRQQNVAQIIFRFRQRTMFFFPLKTNTSLKAYSFFNEVFYNFFEHRVSENQICPCQLTFEINKKLDLELFFIVSLFVFNEKWKKSFITGTQFLF